MAAAMFFAAVPELASESVTLTTYYPAPSGVYSQLITTGNTWLSRDTGNVVVGGSGAAIARLDVTGVTGTAHIGGWLQADNAIKGAYGLIPGYAAWGAYGTGSGGAAIYNDGTSQRALVIEGNNSSGVNTVKIGLNSSDQLYVNGTANVNGSETVNGNLTVNAGNGKNGYLTLNTSGCGAVNVTQGPVCGSGQYATWTPGVNIQGYWQYQNRGSQPYIVGNPAGGQVLTNVTRISNPEAPTTTDNLTWGNIAVDNSHAVIYCCPL